MRYSLFYITSFGFIAGIVISSFINISIYHGGVIFLILAALVFYIFKTYKYSYQFIIIIFLLCTGAGICRYALFVRATGSPVLENQVGNPVELTGIVVTEPNEREKSIRLTIRAYDIKIILNDHVHSRIKYGDEVMVKGRLAKPENFETDIGREFNYVAYLQKEKIFYEIKSPKVTFVSSGHGNIIKDFLYTVKNTFIKKLDIMLPFPESRLGAGIIVAGKRALPQHVLDDFQKAGAMQVVVLSGYNVSIIATAFLGLLSSFPKLIGVGVGSVGIILFTIMAGGAATIVRGCIMAIIVLIAETLRRPYLIGRSLTAAAVLMLLINPMLLAYDPSFQLSFLATIGLVYVTPLFKKYLRYEIISSSVATQLFVTPYILYSTGEMSMVALPVNVILSLIIPVAMLTSFLTGLMAFIHPFVSWPFALLAYGLLWAMLTLVHTFALLPFAVVTLPSFPQWMLWMSYGCYGVLLWRFYRVKQEKGPTERVS